MIFRCRMSVDELRSVDIKVLTHATRELLRAHREGFHFLIFDRHVAEFLGKNCVLDPDHKSLLRRLYDEYAIYGNLPNEAKVCCEIVSKLEISQEDYTIKVNFSAIGHATVGNPSLMIVEDEEADGEFLKMLLLQNRDLLNIPAVSVSVVHGGGSGIVKVFERRLQSKNITVAVCDSDMKCPGAHEGSAIKAMREAANDWPLSKVLYAPCHEVENLIPQAVALTLKSAINCPIIKLTAQAELWEANIEVDAPLWHYIDLKKGISEEHLLRLSGSARQWLRERMQACGFELGDAILSGFGDGMVGQLLTTGASLNLMRKHVRQAPWQNHFGIFISQLIWWFAAPKSLRT